MTFEDRLEKMFNIQQAFNEQLFEDEGYNLANLSSVEKELWSKDFILHITDELHEFLREINWKMHSKLGQSIDRENVMTEWIDSLKFLIGLAQIWGFSTNQIFDEFERKSQVVEYRYLMEKRLKSFRESKQVVAVDIDGVLNCYPDEFISWVRRRDDQYLNEITLASLKKNSVKYAKLKDKYRRSGEKAQNKVKNGAKELLDTISLNSVVVIFSRRPYWKYSRIYQDTLDYLNNNGLYYNGILFHPNKHERILKFFPYNLKLVIEDDPFVARELVKKNVDVILIENEINKNTFVEGVHFAENLEVAIDISKKLLGNVRK